LLFLLSIDIIKSVCKSIGEKQDGLTGDERMENLTYKSESEKQFEYMKQMKEWVKQESEKLGRKLTCHITTFGCP
jgi:hypothetical protein